MTGVVIPDPRGGHVWVYGVDGSGNPVKVLVDASGHPQVVVTGTWQPGGEVHVFADATAVANATTTTVVSHTTTAGKTFYLTDLMMSEATTGAASVEAVVFVDIGGARKMRLRVPPSDFFRVHFNTPIAIGAGVVLDLRVHQWTGAGSFYSGNIIGWEE